MEKTRIAELLRPFLTWDLSDRQLGSISIYIDILLKWNQRMNLTAVRESDEIVTRHFGESLFAAQALFPAHLGTAAPESLPRAQSRGPADRRLATQTRASGSTSDEAVSNATTVVDVGSGAGFPGLPIKIWTTEILLTLIESNHKKATFLREVVRTLPLEGVEVFSGRAESFPAASADVVTLRAVERFEDILPIVTALVRYKGRLALLIGNSQIEQAKSAARDLEWQAAIRVPLSNNRALLVGKK
jgi:16S rRNA (guanine527-N7)-methyltransferase